jgi:hypothetical protein
LTVGATIVAIKRKHHDCTLITICSWNRVEQVKTPGL